jgi:glutamine cyclotransferase
MSRIRSIVFVLISLFLTVATAGAVATAAQVPGPVAPVRSYEVVAEFPHDPNAFTQGLILVDGQLYEGTGLNGASELRLVDLETGDVLQSHDLDEEHFGEGITVLGDRIYQITWKTGTAFVYDRETFQQTGSYSYDTEGWGLTHDGAELIMSDGSDQLYFRDPETFEVTRQLSVKDGETPVFRLNELEYIDGVIWANVWQTSLIARIDPETGDVIDWLDLSALTEKVAASGQRIDVLNGIAWNPETETVYVTGKLWPTLFEIKLISEN